MLFCSCADYYEHPCSSTRDYPNDLPPNEIYVDMEGQAVFVPINGSSVPFHISVIKNTVQPDPDRASA